MTPEPIEEILNQYVAAGKISPELHRSVLQLLKAQSKPTLTQAAGELYKLRFGEDEAYQQFVQTTQRDGYWFTEEEHLQHARSNLDGIIREASEKGDTNYLELAERLDLDQDADLYAAFILNIPEVRQRVLEQIGAYENLYRVTHSILRTKKQEKVNQYKEDRETTAVPSGSVYIDVLNQLPDGHFAELKEPTARSDAYGDKKRLFLILREKIRRDCLRFLGDRKSAREVVSGLETYVTQQQGNVRFLYEDQLDQFRHYLDLQEEMLAMGYINPEFRHPITGERGVLPSFHQLVAMSENLAEQRFGVFDDCGTGKTAIAALLKPLIEKRRTEQGKEVYGRTLVIGPKASTKAWSDGLEGAVNRRYFAEQQRVVWINGRKDEAFLRELREADFIFVNYEQLTCDFSINGDSKRVFDVLMELGYDHVIVDEVQEAKNLRTRTKNGKVTESLAVRMLVTHPAVEYVTLLSGTPLPDNLDDYANILFILKPEYFMEEVAGKRQLKFEDVPKRFYEIYEGNPRALYALARERTIRRTSAEVIDVPKGQIIYEDVELTPVQRQIIDYVFEHGHKDWLTQIRYAALDPRLVSPRVLQEMDLLGKVSRADAAKYRRLEEILRGEKKGSGPFARGEKVVIFSSMFAEGVTREAKRLAAEYQELGLTAEYERLGLHTLQDDLQDSLRRQYGLYVNLVAIDKDTPHDLRETAVDKLRDDLNGLVCTTKSGGVSLDFSAATTAIFLDQDYSPATTDQAIARLVRQGQKHHVKVYFLRGQGSLDASVEELLGNKRENIQMALDGIELIDREKEILWGRRDEERLKDLFLKGRGGIAIDVTRYVIDEVDAFETRKVQKKTGTSRPASRPQNFYEQTVAQEIREAIAIDPVNCWQDEVFVQKYVDNFHTLGPYLLARAKVLDLVRRSARRETNFPRLLLADAAGQGILYTAFQDLESVIAEQGFNSPVIIDRDFSPHMHRLSPNPHKYLADMCGQSGFFDEAFFEEFGHFDFVDNSSITLLPNRRRIRDYIVEANRLLSPEGYLQLGIGGWRFSKDFFQGMQEAGFKPLVRSHQHTVSQTLFKRLKTEFGQHYAESYRQKLDSTTFSLFQKVDEVNTVDPKYFLLENPEYQEDAAKEQPAKGEATPVLSVTNPITDNRKKKYTGKKKLVVDHKTGLVEIK